MEKGPVHLIYIGIFLSTMFSSAIEPDFRATVSEILTKDDYTRASSLMGLSGAARYLIAPLLAGILMNFVSVETMILMDAGTVIITITATFMANMMLSHGRYGMEGSCDRKKNETVDSKMDQSKEESKKESKEESSVSLSPLRLIGESKVLKGLLILSSIMTFFLGMIQTLFAPLILSFTSDAGLGRIQFLAGLECWCPVLFSQL